MRWRTHLEHSLAAAMKLHAEADAAGFTGAGELAEQCRQDRAGQSLLQKRRLYDGEKFTQVKRASIISKDREDREWKN